MSTITESVIVTVPIRTAYDQWTRFQAFPRFMDGVEEIRRLGDRTLRWTTRNGPTLAGVVTFHRLDETTTRVTAQLELDPEGLAGRAGDRTGALTHRVRGDLRRFKTLIEARGAGSGPAVGAARADRPEP
ncbi:SRPBCC family protein [Actinomadura geliboluensis]|uniref:SRPBCC family protein n=1 Tax=Actinomadura geliboluensis TaxID=882440 RepID=UPI002634B4C1|nr:SRPBCC family protein [Actinomadura geliboluensis]